eukprot:tig00000113_g5609.t1
MHDHKHDHAQVDREVSLEELASLQPWPGLTLEASITNLQREQRPSLGLFRAFAGALADAGKLEIYVPVSREADLAPLVLLVPLGRRLRITVEIGVDVERDEPSGRRLVDSARSFLRGCLAQSNWSVAL